MSYFNRTSLTDILEGNNVQVSSAKALFVTESFRLVGTVFTSVNDPNFYTISNSGTGSGVTVNNIATLTSGTANSGYGQITTVRLARFIFNNPAQYRATIRVTATTVANNSRRWGAFTLSGQTPQDGFYFELSGTNVLSIVSVNAGTPTAVNSGSWNGTVASFAMDTNMHAYEIMYLQASVYFYIDNVWIHKITPTTAPMTSSLTLPATATSINSASGTASGVLEVWANLISRLCKENSSPKPIHIAGAVANTVYKYGAGRLRRVVFNAGTGSSLISVYDNAVPNTTNPLALISSSNGAIASLDYDIDFYNGLSVSTTVASTDITLIVE